MSFQTYHFRVTNKNACEGENTTCILSLDQHVCLQRLALWTKHEHAKFGEMGLTKYHLDNVQCSEMSFFNIIQYSSLCLS